MILNLNDPLTAALTCLLVFVVAFLAAAAPVFGALLYDLFHREHT